jgi:hypothetical protein
MSFRVYVAAPYGDASLVRRVHDLLRRLRLEPTSRWAENALGAENIETLPLDVVQALAEVNDRDLLDADAVLVLPRDGAGREMYAEARLALEHRIPVFWSGRPLCLSSFRAGVRRCSDLVDAVLALLELARIDSPVAPTSLLRACITTCGLEAR